MTTTARHHLGDGEFSEHELLSYGPPPVGTCSSCGVEDVIVTTPLGECLDCHVRNTPARLKESRVQDALEQTDIEAHAVATYLAPDGELCLDTVAQADVAASIDPEDAGAFLEAVLDRIEGTR